MYISTTGHPSSDMLKFFTAPIHFCVRVEAAGGKCGSALTPSPHPLLPHWVISTHLTQDPILELLWKFYPACRSIPHSFFERVSRSYGLFTAQRACVCACFPLLQLWNSSVSARSQGGTRLRSHTDIHLTAEGQSHTSQRTGRDFHTLLSGD